MIYTLLLLTLSMFSTGEMPSGQVDCEVPEMAVTQSEIAALETLGPYLTTAFSDE